MRQKNFFFLGMMLSGKGFEESEIRLRGIDLTKYK
uniref:Uncharacterized protein n=1 Tax=Arundo donax TaxID=35708 RepID=A0A0A9BFM0_ARUDO